VDKIQGIQTEWKHLHPLVEHDHLLLMSAWSFTHRFRSMLCYLNNFQIIVRLIRAQIKTNQSKFSLSLWGKNLQKNPQIIFFFFESFFSFRSFIDIPNDKVIIKIHTQKWKTSNPNPIITFDITVMTFCVNWAMTCGQVIPFLSQLIAKGRKFTSIFKR
jgi:hypothetical protein